MIDFPRVIPILRIFELAKAREFYLDFLGCSIDWQHGGGDSPHYIQVSRAELVLHLTEHHGDTTPGTRVFIETRGIEALYAELSGKAYRFNRPGLETVPWGKELEVSDPFGNRLTFTERKP